MRTPALYIKDILESIYLQDQAHIFTVGFKQDLSPDRN
jgi:hypothetical protein